MLARLLPALFLLATAVPAIADGPDCDMPETPQDIIYCTTRNIDAPAAPTTHAVVSVVAAGCYVEEVRAHASGKGFEYDWQVSAGNEEDSGTEAGLPSPMVRDGPFDLAEGESVGGSASIQNTALPFDRASDSRSWTCVGGELVEEVLTIVQELLQ